MGLDVNETAWCILETLAAHGPLHANQSQAKTKKINRITMYKAFPLLQKDGLIQRDKNKIYSLNTEKFLEGKKYLKSYEEFCSLSEGAKKIFNNLEKLTHTHKRILTSQSDQNVNIAKEVLRSRDFVNLINITVRIFQQGPLMEFLVSTGLFSEIVKKNALRLKRKNEDMCSKYLKTLAEIEPVLWGEIVMLIQNRLKTQITSA